jgi:hypothetical protein
MFEFHGWAVITVDDLDDEGHDTLRLATIAAKMADAEAALQVALANATDTFCVFEIQHTCNALRYLTTHGVRNHRYQPVIDLFQWIADHLPACYGLLYIHDVEDMTRTGDDFSNCFRVWRLARGQLTEQPDPFLSPCIPTIEVPEEPT